MAPERAGRLGSTTAGTNTNVVTISTVSSTRDGNTSVISTGGVLNLNVANALSTTGTFTFAGGQVNMNAANAATSSGLIAINGGTANATAAGAFGTGPVLIAIYEMDFLGFSYGFRPGTQPAQRAGRPLHRVADEEGELGARRGHSRVL